jgi:UDP-N-acetylmuramate--alanine ligase
VTIEALAAAVNNARSAPVHLVPGLDDVAARVADIARSGDLVITLGAGSIGGLATTLVEELRRRHG